jgi:iron complex transport system ATP-binding protein
VSGPPRRSPDAPPGGAPGAGEIRLEGVAVELGGREVLHGIDATFAAGRFTAIVGPNGAGKSTLVRAGLGILPVSRGAVTVGGRDLRRLRRREVARAMAFVPQDTHLEFAFTVEEVVAMGRYPHLDPLAREGPDDREAVRRAMERLELEPLARRPVTALSGGERQRAFIARALATEAPALVLDEPISSLDIGHRLDILEFLGALAAAGKTVVAVLHDLELALRFCDPILVLADGRAVGRGGPEEVLESGVLEEAFGVRIERGGGGGDGAVRFHRR